MKVGLVIDLVIELFTDLFLDFVIRMFINQAVVFVLICQIINLISKINQIFGYSIIMMFIVINYPINQIAIVIEVIVINWIIDFIIINKFIIFIIIITVIIKLNIIDLVDYMEIVVVNLVIVQEMGIEMAQEMEMD